MAILDSLSDELLIHLKNRLKTYNEMGKALNVSSTTICKEFKKRGLAVNKLGHLSDSELIQYRKKNMTYEEIGNELNVSTNTVIAEYRARGIDIGILRENSRILEGIANTELVQLRLNGMSYQEIANKYNVSKSLVVNEFKRRGIRDNLNNKKCKIVSLDSSFLESLRIDGNTYESIAEILDVSTVTIHKEYKKRGLK